MSPCVRAPSSREWVAEPARTASILQFSGCHLDRITLCFASMACSPALMKWNQAPVVMVSTLAGVDAVVVESTREVGSTCNRMTYHCMNEVAVPRGSKA